MRGFGFLRGDFYDNDTTGYTPFTSYFNGGYYGGTTEAVTQTATQPSYTPSVQTNVTQPSYTPGNFNTPAFDLPSLPSTTNFNTPAFNLPPAPTPGASGGGAAPVDPSVEAVTVSADAQGRQVQAVTPAFYPDFSSPAFQLQDFSSPNVESVTVDATREPYKPELVAAKDFNPVFTPWAFEGYTPNIPPLPPANAAAKKAAAPSKGGGAGGGSGGGAPPKIQINLPPKPPALPANPVTPQQQAALSGLTPQQLAALLANPNLTAAQRAAVQQALANKVAAGVPGAAAAQAAAQQAAAAASPFQTSAAMLPLLLVGGVVAAYAVTHRHQISAQVQTQYRAVRRRVRKVFT